MRALGSKTIDGATYNVDNAGNRTAKTDWQANVTSNYGYDQIYELLSATQGGTTTESYTYDPVGNRLSSLGLSPYQYNVSNELTQTPNTIYAQDADGNTTIKTDSTGSTTYTWDYENRLTSVTLPGTVGTVNFKYDPSGRRIQKSFTQPGNPPTTTVTNYAYNGDNIVDEIDAGANIVAKYAQGQGVDQPLAMLRSGATSYFQADGLGSVTSLTNGAGTLAQTYTFDSFGNQTTFSGSFTNPFRYAARELDTNTGLYFNRARYYDPQAGRFLSEDLIRYKDGLSHYIYVLNSPTNLLDPTGLCPWEIHTRPMKDFPEVLDISHMYFYNTQTGQSVGLGFTGWWMFSAPGQWETNEIPGNTDNDRPFPQPIPDDICSCVDRHAKNPGKPPHYCLLAKPGNPKCQNCWNWVLDVVKECREELYD